MTRFKYTVGTEPDAPIREIEASHGRYREVAMAMFLLHGFDAAWGEDIVVWVPDLLLDPSDPYSTGGPYIYRIYNSDNGLICRELYRGDRGHEKLDRIRERARAEG